MCGLSITSASLFHHYTHFLNPFFVSHLNSSCHTRTHVSGVTARINRGNTVIRVCWCQWVPAWFARVKWYPHDYWTDSNARRGCCQSYSQRRGVPSQVDNLMSKFTGESTDWSSVYTGRWKVCSLCSKNCTKLPSSRWRWEERLIGTWAWPAGQSIERAKSP